MQSTCKPRLGLPPRRQCAICLHPRCPGRRHQCYFRQGYTNLSYLTSPSSSLHKSFKSLLMRVGLTLMTVNSRQPSLSCCGCTHLKYTANWRRCDKFVHLPSSVKTFFYFSSHIMTSSTDIIQLVVRAVLHHLGLHFEYLHANQYSTILEPLPRVGERVVPQACLFVCLSVCPRQSQNKIPD